MIVKKVTLGLLIGLITAVHVLYPGSEQGFHILHQQLFFIPLILASFWFGIRTGAIIVTIISLLYGFPMVFSSHGAGGHLIVLTQICLYFFVALLIGWLSDRQRKQQNKMFQNAKSTALGKAASALSFEVQDIVRRIESIHQHIREEENSSENDEILYEIDRLKRLLEALNKFSKPLGKLTLSHNLNDLILQRLPTYHQSAASEGIKIVTDLDQNECPSMVITESIPSIIDALVDNAIDFSARGRTIVLRSKRRGDFCIVEVEDFGSGVSKEHEGKLFTAFFTTKIDGYGLSLSSGRKALRNLGGDLSYRSKENAGAIFRMKIPRENSAKNIQEYANSALPKS